MATNYKTPFLLIETPRAGKWNFRHIIPPNLWINEQQVLFIIDSARAKKYGKNFLAVGHDNVVKQFHGSRCAPELLILAGIDTQRLSSKEKQELCDSLQFLLGEVDQLVTQIIDWDTENRHGLVKREELANWFEQYIKNIKPLKGKFKNKIGLFLSLGIIVIFLTIIIPVYRIQTNSKEQQTSVVSEKKVSKKIISDTKITWNDFNQKFSQLENNVKQTFLLLKEKASQN